MYSFTFSPYSTGVEVLIFEINQRHIFVTLFFVFSHLETLFYENPFKICVQTCLGQLLVQLQRNLNLNLGKIA